jgi:predicted MFS family arabinose efflux permease
VAEDKADKPQGPGQLTGRGWPLLLVLAAIQFSHIIDFAILMPLGPRYQRELGIDPVEFGLVVSIYAFAACLSGLLASSLIDRFDRKRALLVLYAGFVGGTLLCGLASTYGLLLLGRCLAGAFGGVLGAVIFTIVGDVFPENRRGLATGVVMTAVSVATIAGIPLGLTLAHYLGTGSPFIALAGFSAAVLLLGVFVLPSLRHHLNGPRETVSPWRILVQPAHLRAYALMVAMVLGMFMLFPNLPSFLMANVGWQETDLRWMYLCGGAVTLFTNSLFGRLADRFGKLIVFRVLALLTLIPIVVLTNLGQTPLAAALVVTTLLFMCGNGRIVPAMALITSSARPAYRGSFLSVSASVQQMAMGLAALLAGIMLHQDGPSEPVEGYPLVGLVACATTVLSVVLAGAVRPAGQADEAEPSPAALGVGKRCVGLAPVKRSSQSILR